MSEADKDDIAFKVWSRTQAPFTTPGTFGYNLDVAVSSRPTTAAITTAVWAYVVEGSMTAVQWVRLMIARHMTKATVTDNGDGTTTFAFRSLADDKDRIVGIVENATGSRTDVTTRDGS